MDVFKMFDFSWKHPIRSIKYFFKALKWSRQRVKKGYCDWDVMDIDTWFAELMPRMLRDFKSGLTEQEHPVLPEFFDEYYALFIENIGMRRKSLMRHYIPMKRMMNIQKNITCGALRGGEKSLKKWLPP